MSKHGRAERFTWSLLLAGGAAWFGGASLSAFWMFHGGGIPLPIASFAAYSTLISFLVLHSERENSQKESTGMLLVSAVRYGAYSALGLAFCTLLLEYWPITIGMAFMFAMFRIRSKDDTPAFV